MDPSDFSWVHIPCDEVQVSGPRRDVSRIEFATATLASRGQVIILLTSFPINFIFVLLA